MSLSSANVHYMNRNGFYLDIYFSSHMRDMRLQSATSSSTSNHSQVAHFFLLGWVFIGFDELPDCALARCMSKHMPSRCSLCVASMSTFLKMTLISVCQFSDVGHNTHLPEHPPLFANVRHIYRENSTTCVYANTTILGERYVAHTPHKTRLFCNFPSTFKHHRPSPPDSVWTT